MTYDPYYVAERKRSLAAVETAKAADVFALTSGELEIIKRVRQAQAAGNAEVIVTFVDGNRVKLWLTYKYR